MDIAAEAILINVDVSGRFIDLRRPECPSVLRAGRDRMFGAEEPSRPQLTEVPAMSGETAVDTPKLGAAEPPDAEPTAATRSLTLRHLTYSRPRRAA